MRILLGALGAVLIGYGAYLLISRQDTDQIIAAATWLIFGVILHDALLAPLTILLAVVAVRVLSPALRRAATVALLILGPLTLLAIPVLGRLGARPDNPTLLDQDYLTAWSLILAATVVAVLVAGVLLPSRRQAKGGPSDGPRPRR